MSTLVVPNKRFRLLLSVFGQVVDAGPYRKGLSVAHIMPTDFARLNITSFPMYLTVIPSTFHPNTDKPFVLTVASSDRPVTITQV